MATKNASVKAESLKKTSLSTPRNQNKNLVKDDPDLHPSSSDDDDNVPLASKLSSKSNGVSSTNVAKKRPSNVNSTNHSDKNGKTSLSQPPSKRIKDEKSSPAAPPPPVKSSPKTGTTNNSSSSNNHNSSIKASPSKRGSTNSTKEEPVVWEWWKESKLSEGQKWKTLIHQGPMFAPPYVPLPKHVKFYYNQKEMALSPATEEVATFYGRMLDHDYTSKPVFNTNFFKDWCKVMTSQERAVIKDLALCDFREYDQYFKRLSEERKNRSKEEKLAEKKLNAEITEKYGFCWMDNYKQKIANFRIEPPGLFRGRGDHPKMGMLKVRLQPEDVIINCSKGDQIPRPPDGHHWKEVRHDPSVSWLACWQENVQGNLKYVMLNASSKLKGEKDWVKYETARKLHAVVDRIRNDYQNDFKHKEMRIRQRAVALYFIDKLALRAGNEKDEDEADTVGCCSLRVEHIKLHDELGGNKHVVEFDFLGKDSIRYQNSVPVVKRVFKNLRLFMTNKQQGDDLFDRLNTGILNQYLRDLMPGLTAKVFRTYNASKTLEEELARLTNPAEDISKKILAYNRANRSVAILCNHQRSVPKTFAKSMENMQNKIAEKKEKIREAKLEFKRLKAEYVASHDVKKKILCERKKKAVATLKEQLSRLEVQATDKDENKEIALGTSKLNYLDPRISVAWCKKNNVPVEKIYNKTQREKFQWAIDMATADFVFRDVCSDTNTNRMETTNDNDNDNDNEADDNEDEYDDQSD